MMHCSHIQLEIPEEMNIEYIQLNLIRVQNIYSDSDIRFCKCMLILRQIYKPAAFRIINPFNPAQLKVCFSIDLFIYV